MRPELHKLELPVPDGLKAAIEAFDCCDPANPDPNAMVVREYLHAEQYVQGIQQGTSTTYLLLDMDVEPPRVLGYITVASALVILGGGERRRAGLLQFREFPALRLAWIGVEHSFQREGHGTRLLEATAGLALKVREYAAVRFLLADANPAHRDWYLRHGWVENKSDLQRRPEGTISMRFDLGPGASAETPSGTA